MRAFTEPEAVQRHEQCREHFLTAMSTFRSLVGAGQTELARSEILRANAAVAQGLVWAEVIGIDQAGWLDRMHDIEKAWREVNGGIL